MTSNRRIWHFEDFDSWESDVRELISPYVDRAVINSFRQRPPKYVVSDDLGWLDEIIERVKGEEVDIKSYLADQLHVRFDAIRGYHGARPSLIESYYARGLEPLDVENIMRIARDFFLSGRFPELREEDVDRAISLMNSNPRQGRIYFEATRRMLEDDCAHYMLYGSEYITGVAAALGANGRDYRQALKTIGRPTIFVCDIPLSWMHDRHLADFAGMALEAIFESILNPEYRHPPNGRGTAIVIRRDLPPDYIVDHYHPVRLRDPLLGRRWCTC